MDKEIYPRNAIDHRRVDMFAENMRDGFTFEPIDVEVHPEEDARETARRAFQKNPRLTSAEVGQAIGRSRRTVDSYISDLKAAVQMDLDLKIFRMNRLGISQDRIAKRLGAAKQTISSHLPKMAVLPNLVNADLKRGFTVPKIKVFNVYLILKGTTFELFIFVQVQAVSPAVGGRRPAAN